MKTMKSVLSANIDVKVDRNLMKDFQRYVMGIYTRDDDHVKFLSGNLIGIHTPYFFTSDANYFWDSVMEVDRVHLASEFYFPNTVVRPEWNVAGDLMNNGMVWLIHLILNSKLNSKDQELFVKDILILFQYKFLTSKIFRDYGKGAKLSTAMAAHDQLGGHFLIKSVDSWMLYFKLRAGRMWAGEGKRKDMMSILKSYDKERDVTNVISGISNNMNTMIKAYNKVFYDIHEAGGGINLSSPITIDKEGVETVSDHLTSSGRYIQLIESRIGIVNELIDESLMEMLVNETSARFSKVLSLVKYISKTYDSDKDTGACVRNGIIFAFTELFNSNIEIDCIRTVVKELLGKMGARRIGDEVFDKFEKSGRKMLKRSIGDNKHGLAARNVAIVYIIAWVLVSDKKG